MRSVSLFALSVVVAGPLVAQVPDTTRADTSAMTLPEITVTVTRSTETVARVPAAIGVVDRHDIQGAQATLGLDEALANLPGVFVANRYNYSLDQRLSIRGAGSRANFGLRGVKVLLDGVPQTLPDGQSQLTNVDFANVQRIEVLRGASSSLYGNASGGVLSLTSEGAGSGPFSQSVRVEGGSFGLFKIHGRTTARRGLASGTLSLSRTQVDGFRQNSATEFTQLNLGATYVLGTGTSLGVRFGYTNAPKAQNPGALTATEVLANPDSAGANNILRRADKDVSQGQLALTGRHPTGRGHVELTVFGFLRDLENPLATPPPSGTGPTVGTYVRIDRKAYGLRLATEQHIGASDRAARVTAGLDMQRLRDDRSNFRAVAGVPDTAILDQQERVTEIGPFIQIHASPVPDLVVGIGGRYDRSLFVVQDRHLTDGVDNTGDRTMSAFSANGGMTWVRDLRFSPYVNVSTSFETPTTTELANQPNSSGGFNTSLDPQRTVNFEVGTRGTVGRLTYSLTGYLSRIKDAIVQYQEVSGRAYFTNAGKVKNDGIELGLSAAVTGGLRVFGNYTWSDFRFDEYRIERSVNNAIVVDTLDGNRLPGVPKAFIRLGVRAGPFRGFSADLDHTMASSMYADDRNTLAVDGFGSSPRGNIKGLGNGVTNVRFSWEGRAGGAWVRPFIGINNLWDRTYVSSFTINGTFGRVFETAPGRNYYIGGEIGWAAR